MKYFGTDGIRDRVTGPLLDPGFVYRLGRAVGQWISREPAPASRHVAIGRDTRSSGATLFLAISRGLHREGVRIFDAGVCPTPAVAKAVDKLGLDLGVVITASHNPATDNGIKLFGPGGFKLSEDQEAEIEALLDAIPEESVDSTTSPPVRYYEARRHYLRDYHALMPENALMGLRIVLDCANGATSQTSGEFLTGMGAQLITFGDMPDGRNINDGVGSECPEVISKAVVEKGADLGIAHDGDGDRVILCDHHGRIIDGDAVLAILGAGWAKRDALPGRTVVATIMSNLGLDKCLAEQDVRIDRVGVGDRQVFYRMKDKGYTLGGESSGHFIAMEYLPTGDGLLAAILVLREMLHTGRSLAELASIFNPFPQEKKNLPMRDKPSLAGLPDLQTGLDSLEKRLGSKGRILLRYSGTEPKIRLLAEAETDQLAKSVMTDLESLVREQLPVAG